MSWTVDLTENTLKTSIETCEKLQELLDGEYYFDYDTETGQVHFDPDAMEWIDFIEQNEEARQLLESDPATNGIATFYAPEGDNQGDAWGHKFENGKYTYLRGKIVYEEVN
jgi:hypothetical protein